MRDFSGRVAFVTGAAGNLGTTVARAFQDAGARTVLVDRDASRLQQVFPELLGAREHLLVEGVDLKAPGALDGVVTRAVELFGRVDILVNAVGGFRGGAPVHETPLETWDVLLDLNLRTSVVAARAVIPAMLRQRYGKIVLVAARAAGAGAANLAAYSAAKAAVVRLTESMAAELKGDGINVNCVLPGTIDTAQNRQERPGADHAKWVPPSAIADVILFLASDAARAVVGASVPVFGLS
ncbi:MAG: SDR family NAD(P)-dependent oxidoreductase [Thermoanaerobaculaceae bacterium]|nr:SDR family NAD(P)-dependent oxidoreductase [Thermoanaerobaculaceae bacterium]TAM44740.1 MAG: SDR family NAD(P)-dependent oxidoreductase [Acidobacteriota bacterium]